MKTPREILNEIVPDILLVSHEHFEWLQTICNMLEQAEAREAVLRDAMTMASAWLDGIRANLYASVYTVEDDQFEQIYSARDTLDEALAKYRKMKGDV